jgi:heme exporter protein A
MARLDSVEAHALACERGGRIVFRALDFAVERGDALSLEGPNGAGKTSLLRMIAGLLPPAMGTLSFASPGGNVSDAEERGRFVGWLGHHDGIKAQLSVAENAAFAAALYGPAGGGATAMALDRVALARIADLPGQYLSAGQRRRLALARLLLCNRPLWLLDEPLAALDAAGKRLAAELIAAHCAGGGIVIAATHESLGLAGPRLTLGTA